MVTGIKSINHQQVNAMGLNGITAASVSQMSSQEVPVKRSTTTSDARRVSLYFFYSIRKKIKIFCN